MKGDALESSPAQGVGGLLTQFIGFRSNGRQVEGNLANSREQRSPDGLKYA